MSTDRIISLFVALLCLAFAAPAAAETPPPNDASDEEREAFMSRLKMMRMYALTEALELDEATAARLFPYLREGDEAIGKAHREVRIHRKALRNLATEDSPKDADIDPHIAAIAKLEQVMTALRADQIDGLKGILSAEQRLRFVLTHARIERELRSALRDRRQRAYRGERGERRERGEGRGRGGPDGDRAEPDGDRD
jgi:hypothetical protein